MMKHLLSIILAAVLLFGSWTGVFLRSADAETPPHPETLTIPAPQAEEEQPSNDDLFTQYLCEMIRSADPSMEQALASRSLPHLDALLNPSELAGEQAFKRELGMIANGTRTDTTITVDFSTLDGDYDVWDVLRYVEEAGSYSIDVFFFTLLRDCTYELYWSARRFGSISISGNSLTIPFYVADGYAGEDTLSVDPTAVQTAKTAVQNAKNIVESNKSRSDYDKLIAYRDRICELTDYNHDAANNMEWYVSRWQMNPWELIWVFDGNPDTMVVCEGYSKAFEYLCNLSTFQSARINCFCVSGDVTWSNGGGGGHMWNIVTMDDGRNYLVDVTNCDNWPDPNVRFLKHAVSGSVDDGYTIDTGDYYPYDEETRAASLDASLTLSDQPYQKPSSAIVYGDANGDGEVKTLDAAIVLRYVVGLISLTEEQLRAVDVDGRPGVKSSDAAVILRYAVGLVKSLPLG